MSAYLIQLTMRLAHGVSLLPQSRRQRHGHYFRAAQRSDGGFAGREGESDLYYTGFALRALSILGLLEGKTAEHAAAFLRTRLSGRESIIDFFSLIYSSQLLQAAAGIDVFQESAPDWRSSVAETLEKLRRDDGGYAKALAGHAGSTYHTFLVVLCLQLLEQPIPHPDRIVQFLAKRQSDDGGFLEISVGKRPGANPTAAAVATLKILNALDQVFADDAAEFVAELQSTEGGFLANTRIPVADTLSTFTSLLTMMDLNALDRVDLDRLAKFVHDRERREGGFHAGSFDYSHDVEYSFYGLATMATLAWLHADGQSVDAT